jgi:hypothetical protein
VKKTRKPIACGALACLLCLLPGAARSDDFEASRWGLQVSGYSHHFQSTRNRSHPSWNDRNIGLGLQYDLWRKAESPWSTVGSLGFMKDSYDVYGYYAGGAQFYRLIDRRVKVKTGIGALAVYRAFAWNREKDFALLVMPVFSIEDSRSGLGVNITGSPSIRYGNRKIVSFVFIQGVYRF